MAQFNMKNSSGCELDQASSTDDDGLGVFLFPTDGRPDSAPPELLVGADGIEPVLAQHRHPKPDLHLVVTPHHGSLGPPPGL